jgi:hypothetical protein
MAVDMLFDPLTYIGIFGGVDNIGLGAAMVSGVDTRARNLKTLDDIRKGSLDYYATIRSLYRQRRADEISNGETPPTDETSPADTGEGVGDGQSSGLTTSPQVSTAPLVPRQRKLAKALPMFAIKEPAGPLPATLEP